MRPIIPQTPCRAVETQALYQAQGINIRLPLSLDFWLVPDGFLDVQSIHTRRLVGGFDWMCALNSK